MITVDIDISDVVADLAALNRSSNDLKAYVLDEIVSKYRFHWEELVSRELKGTRREYLSSMYFDKKDDNSAVVGLTSEAGGLTFKIEDGAEPFDMKEGFARSSKKKPTKSGGWQLIIPFRHATSQALAESGAFSGVLPASVQQVARRAGGRQLSLSDLPPEYQRIQSRAEIRTPTTTIPEYRHRSAIYQGLQRTEVGAPGETRGAYMTFRKVSDKSNPYSWYHPGIKAHNFMQRALQATNIDRVVDDAIDAFLGD